MDVIIGLVCWILFAASSSIAADARGHGGAVWFFIGLLIGPFALIMVLVDKQGSKGMKRCLHCIEPVHLQATACRYCGRDL